MSQDPQLPDNRWDFPWPIMEVLIGGKSSIDLPRLHFKTMDQANEFVRNYGYDPDNPGHARMMHALIMEAIHFIHRILIPAEWARGLRPPEDMLKLTRVAPLLLFASDQADPCRQAWACSMLRVLHTLAHIDGSQKIVDANHARDQIMSRFRSKIFRADDGRLRLGAPGRSVAIHKIEWKAEKKRESIILKLLHKPANVAETIYDFFGVRIVTERLCDVMVVAKYLREFDIITFANCNPTRARNNLIELSSFASNVEMLAKMLQEGRINSDQFDQMIDQMTVLEGAGRKKDRKNPHSGDNYRSVQLTCRQMIRFKNPFSMWKHQISSPEFLDGVDADIKSVVNDILLGAASHHWRYDQQQITGFYPFEVQIMDIASYHQNKRGDAAHDQYKNSQIRAARRRVMGPVLKLPRRDSNLVKL